MNVRPENKQIDLAREPEFRLGSAEVRPSTREFLAGDGREQLEPRVMQVLVALARRRGEVVSRDELILLCWNGRVVGDDAINRCIAAVRRLSLGYGGFTIETIPRIGFRLTESAGHAPQAAPAVNVPPRGRLSAAWDFVTRNWLLSSALAGATIVVIVLAAWLWRPAPPASVSPLRPRLTVAVLPFTPLYPGTEAQQLGDAIAFSVADNLASGAFDVISPAKSLQFRGAAKAGAAQALKADFLIDGDLRRAEGRVVASLRLIEGATGTVVIAATLDRPASEAGALPDEVASQLASMGSVAQGYNQTGPWDPRILAGYFKAIFQYGTRGDVFGATETSRSLVRYAPDNAFAQSLHATMAASLVIRLPPDRKPAIIAEARQAANRAIKLDPAIGDPYATLALITPLYEWGVRERYLRRALAAVPNTSFVQIHAIDALQNAGRFGESAGLASAAFKYTRYQTQPLINLINAMLWTGRLSEARSLLDRGRSLYPRVSWFAVKKFEATALHGAYDDADALLEDVGVREVLEPDGSLKTFAVINNALRDRRPADIRTVIDECSRTKVRSIEVNRTCFMALIELRRLEDAVQMALVLYPDQRGPTPEARRRRWLESEIAPTAYLSIPATAPLRAHPRYRELVERVGLFQYWKASGLPPDFCATEKAPICALLK